MVLAASLTLFACGLMQQARADDGPYVPTSTRENSLAVADRGVFSDLDSRVQVMLPTRLTPQLVHALLDRERALLVLYHDAQPIKVYPTHAPPNIAAQPALTTLGLRSADLAELAPLLAAARIDLLPRMTEAPPADTDGDGIPDPLDVLVGAQKMALNADHYDGSYRHLDYPMGDVPRTIGVCTDVVIRALRNAGIDLQRDVHEDIVSAAGMYPMIRSTNTDIDHRRVKTLLTYFARHFEAHDPRDTNLDPYWPGDIIFMDTFPHRPGCEHVGIVSNDRDAQGVPLVINNWTDGTVTRAMRLLPAIPVTQRFRVPPRANNGSSLSMHVRRARQLVVVTSQRFDDWHAQLQRYERVPGRPHSSDAPIFRPVGPAWPAVLGRSGYGWGDGLHGSGAPAGRSGPLKREGDGRSPAGIFAIGVLHGDAAAALPGLRLPYQQATAAQRCVDDPESELYNRIVFTPDGATPWHSAEHMLRDDDVYALALDIDHNRDPVTPGHGSCIFAHVWSAANTPVTGCTALAKANLEILLGWLEPGDAAWVALPSAEYRALRSRWGLP